MNPDVLMLRKWSRWPALALLALAVSACATPAVKLTPADRELARSAPVIAVVRYQTPPPSVQTPKDVAGAGLLAIGTKSANLPGGGELARRYGYPEPTDLIARRLAERLRGEGGLSNVTLAAQPLPLPINNDLGHYATKYKSGLVLEVNFAGGYMLSYLPANWQTYQITLFGGHSRLISPQGGRVLWYGYCNIGTAKDAKLKIDVTEFEANNGARAKQAIATASRACADQLADDFLGKNR